VPPPLLSQPAARRICPLTMGETHKKGKALLSLE
jgi:hypothetical protein